MKFQHFRVIVQYIFLLEIEMKELPSRNEYNGDPERLYNQLMWHKKELKAIYGIDWLLG